MAFWSIVSMGKIDQNVDIQIWLQKIINTWHPSFKYKKICPKPIAYIFHVCNHVDNMYGSLENNIAIQTYM
jgi:hypothetical protein